MKFRVAALLLAGAASAAPPAQNVMPGDPAQKRHAAAVALERSERFRVAWSSADAAAQGRAIDVLAEAGEDLPSIALLTRAERVLAGADAAELAQDDLVGFADALDLRVVPGLFPSASEGRGEPLVVRVYRLAPGVLRRNVELSVIWIAPDGSELRARTESFSPNSFRPPGFNMYVRAPLSEPGLWQLVPELVFDGRRARGVPVPVPCVPEGLLQELREHGHDGKPLFRLLAEGERPLDLPRVLAQARGERVPEILPATFGSTFLRGKRFAEAEDGPMLVFLAPANEPAEGMFAGTSGRSWIEMARRAGVELLSYEVGSTQREHFLEVLSLLPPRRQLILVARGDAVLRAQFLLANGDARLDGLVLCGTRVEPGPSLPSVPTLVVDGRGEGSAGDHQTRVLGMPSAYLTEPDLPLLIEPWLAALASDNPDREGR